MNQTGAAISPAAGNTHLGPLGHLPPPTYQPTLPTHPPSATLLAPTSIIDTITDVSPFIPIVLDLAAHNYYHWRHLFLVHLGRCGLRSHIDATTWRPPPILFGSRTTSPFCSGFTRGSQRSCSASSPRTAPPPSSSSASSRACSRTTAMPASTTWRQRCAPSSRGTSPSAPTVSA